MIAKQLRFPEDIRICQNYAEFVGQVGHKTNENSAGDNKPYRKYAQFQIKAFRERYTKLQKDDRSYQKLQNSQLQQDEKYMDFIRDDGSC